MKIEEALDLIEGELIGLQEEITSKHSSKEEVERADIEHNKIISKLKEMI